MGSVLCSFNKDNACDGQLPIRYGYYSVLKKHPSMFDLALPSADQLLHNTSGSLYALNFDGLF